MSVTGSVKYFLIHASGLVINDSLTTLETSAGKQLAITLQSLTLVYLNKLYQLLQSFKSVY